MVLMGNRYLKQIIVVFLYFVLITKVILECYYRKVVKKIVPYTALSSPNVSLCISMIPVVKIKKPMLVSSD